MLSFRVALALIAGALLLPSSASAATATITSGPANGARLAVSSATFDFVSDDPSSIFECRVLDFAVSDPNPADWTACGETGSGSFTVDTALEGYYTFEVRPTNAGGAFDQAVQRNFKADRTAPSTGQLVPSGYVNNSWSSVDDPTFTTSQVAFHLTASEESGSWTCRVDGGEWAACANTGVADWQLPALADGAHTADATLNDGAGNTQTLTHAFSIDTTDPQTTIVSGPSQQAATLADAFAFEFSASEPVVSYDCRLDGGVWKYCLSPHSVLWPAPGKHTLEVVAKDRFAHTDQTPAGYTWEVAAKPAAPTEKIFEAKRFVVPAETGTAYDHKLAAERALSACRGVRPASKRRACRDRANDLRTMNVSWVWPKKVAYNTVLITKRIASGGDVSVMSGKLAGRNRAAYTWHYDLLTRQGKPLAPGKYDIGITSYDAEHIRLGETRGVTFTVKHPDR